MADCQSLGGYVGFGVGVGVGVGVSGSVRDAMGNTWRVVGSGWAGRYCLTDQDAPGCCYSFASSRDGRAPVGRGATGVV